MSDRSEKETIIEEHVHDSKDVSSSFNEVNSAISTPSSKASEQISKVDSDEIDSLAGEQHISGDAAPPAPAGTNWGICVLCFLVAFGAYIGGWDSGTIGGFESMPDFLRRFGTAHHNSDGTTTYYLQKARMGLITSMYNIGCAGGAFTLGRLGDIIGRKKGLTLAACLFMAGVIVQICSFHAWYQYMIGRIVAGWGYGLIAVLSPMLIAEVSPKNMRGILVSLYQLMCTLGIFLGDCTELGCKGYGNSREWRIGLGLQFAWCTFMASSMALVPESPRFLVEKGRIEDAKRSIAKSNAVSIDDPVTLWELDEIQVAVDKQRAEGESTWAEMFSMKHRNLERTMNGIMLLALQQLTGANYFFYYGTAIFKSVGIQDGYEAAVVFGTVNFFSTICALFFVDTLGRRRVLLYGAFGMTCCMVVFASVGVKLLWPKGHLSGISSQGAGNCMICFSCFFLFCFATSWAPIPFVIISESYSLRCKAKGMTLATISNQLWNFCIGFFTPFITGAIRFAYGYVFMGCIIFSWVYTFLLVPETKGLVLEDVDIMWEEGTLAWLSSSWVPPSERGSQYDTDALANDDVPIYKRMFGSR